MGGKSSTDELDRSPLSNENDELSRNGLNPLNKDRLQQNDSEEIAPLQNLDDSISRDGINALNKDRSLQNDINEEHLGEVDSSLSRDGISPLDKDRIQNESNSLTKDSNSPLDNSLNRDGINPLEKDGLPKNTESEKLASESGSALAPGVSRDGLNPLDKDKTPQVANNTDTGSVIDPNSEKNSGINNPLGKKSSPKSQEQKEKELAASSITNPFGKKKATLPTDNTTTGKISGELIEAIRGNKSNKTDPESKPLLDKVIGANRADLPKKNMSEHLDRKSGAEIWNDKEKDMVDALGSGLTEGASSLSEEEGETNNLLDLQTKIGKKAEEKKPSLDLNKIINGTPQVNTESGELQVVLKQKTNAGNEITFICDFEDFYPDELIVQAPKESILKDSKITGKVTLSYGGKKSSVVISGTVSEIEEFDERKETLVVSIDSIDDRVYEEFIEHYQDRQNSIEDFMLKAKGY